MLGEKYNIGARNQRTNLKHVQAICDIIDEIIGDGVGRRELIKFIADRPGHNFWYAIDPSKVENALGWSPVTFETALRRTVNWYIESGSWWKPIRQKVYTGERLGQIIQRSS